MNQNPSYHGVFKQRIVGLLACAKAVRQQEGKPIEDTAKDVIRLWEILEADARRLAAAKQKPADAVEGFIRDNHLDRRMFIGWLGTFFPEVREGRLERLTDDHANRLLGNPVGCLKAFGEYLVKTSPEGKAPVGQGAATQANNG
jgi:hypothetical protein